MAGNMMESVLVVLVVIVLLIVLYEAATMGSTISSLSSQISAVKSAVSNIQIPQQQAVNLKTPVDQIMRNMTTLSDFSLAGFTLPANQSRVIFDVAGLGGSMSVEMNVKLDEIGALPQDVQVQTLNVTTLQWQSIGEAASAPAKGTFPIQALGDVHNDEQ
ncbi:MAG: hypothetical protein KGH78_04300, partial [Candidatus Micrarchaeota archaeon]|nr:hypothetical protein [Candidatus Micrarchaeota archaeon]